MNPLLWNVERLLGERKQLQNIQRVVKNFKLNTLIHLIYPLDTYKLGFVQTLKNPSYNTTACLKVTLDEFR